MEVPKLMQKALEELKDSYSKILYVNFSTGKFEPVVVPDDEKDIVYKQNLDINSYWNWFIKSGLIHSDDIAHFKEFIKTLQSSYVVYRRKVAQGYHWALMEIKPCKDGQHLLCVKDIDNIYSNEYGFVVDKIGTVDVTTGLLNRFAYDRDCAKYPQGNVGAIFADLNALKYTNDTFGHCAGDKMIKEFSKLLKDYFKGYSCYHISGDEFVVLSFNTNLGEFLRKAKSFHRFLQAMDTPMASVGYSVGETLDGLVEEAESDMYMDKQLFYEKFPKFKRE